MEEVDVSAMEQRHAAGHPEGSGEVGGRYLLLGPGECSTLTRGRRCS